MRRKNMAVVLIAGAVIVLGASLWGPIVSNVEQAKYTVVGSERNIEIRNYDSMVVAEVMSSGDREAAINDGFRSLADYIFGNNTSKNKISMTAPVTQQGSGNEWTIRFVMPSQYTLETLPKPNNDKVKLLETPSAQFAVITFSGRATKDSLKRREDSLKSFINKSGLKSVSEPTYAFFNPPWTLPFLRRNEVMIEVRN
ncbi:MAG: heme-binding protein [Alphaproteobacteria bacterium]|nr:heme-binding protein [Alphaproteobacteria bacterium]